MDWGTNNYPLSNSRACSSARFKPIVTIKEHELPHSHDHTFAGNSNVSLPNSNIPGLAFANSNNINYNNTTPAGDISPSNLIHGGFDKKLESLDSINFSRSSMSPGSYSKVESLLHKYRQLALDAVTLLKREREDREVIKDNMARAAFDAYKSFEDDLKNKALEAIKEMQVEIRKERAIYIGENEDLTEKCKRMEREFNRIRNINLSGCKLLQNMGETDKMSLTEMTIDKFDKFKSELVDSVIKFMGKDPSSIDEQFSNDVEEFAHVAILSQATL